MEDNALGRRTTVEIVYSSAWSGTAEEMLQVLRNYGSKSSMRKAGVAAVSGSPCRILYYDKRHGTRSQAEHLKSLLADKAQFEVEAGTSLSDFQYRILLTQIPYPAMVPSPKPTRETSMQNDTEPEKPRTGGLPWVCPECRQIIDSPQMTQGEALQHLNRHLQYHDTRKSARRQIPSKTCPECGVSVREDKLERHLRNRHGSESDESPSGVPGIPVRQLPFELLPPGSWDIERVINHFRREAHNLPTGLSGRKIQWTRLRELKSLKPTRCYIGTELWLGYVLFQFKNSIRVVLECPIEGNATYVLSGNWKSMVQHTKTYLQGNFPRHCWKVVHKGEWLKRVRQSLGGSHHGRLGNRSRKSNPRG